MRRSNTLGIAVLAGLALAAMTPASAAACTAAAAGVPAAAPTGADGDRPPRFAWPVQGRVVVSLCADARDSGSIDIAAPEGAVVVAAADGIVVYAGDELKAYGNLVIIRHRGGWVTAYAQNDKLLVRRGDAVAQAQPIALVGSSGAARFPHLHFELRRGSQPRNPFAYLPKR
jgi:murein DD-endopeptidase MepM/ murein hydrolase activator NlpD